MRLRRTSGVCPTASRMLLHLISVLGCSSNLNQSSIFSEEFCYGAARTIFLRPNKIRVDYSFYDFPRRRDQHDASEYVERWAVRVHRRILEGGKDGQRHYRVGNYGYGAGWKDY